MTSGLTNSNLVKCNYLKADELLYIILPNNACSLISHMLLDWHIVPTAQSKYPRIYPGCSFWRRPCIPHRTTPRSDNQRHSHCTQHRTVCLWSSQTLPPGLQHLTPLHCTPPHWVHSVPQWLEDADWTCGGRGGGQTEITGLKFDKIVITVKYLS